MSKLKIQSLILLILASIMTLHAEDGYRLWLRYEKISNEALINEYNEALEQLVVEGSSETCAAIKAELELALEGMLGKEVHFADKPTSGNVLIIGTPASSAMIRSLKAENKLQDLGDEGYVIYTTPYRNRKATIITANTDIGLLYGTYSFLRLLQTGQSIAELSVRDQPEIKLRLLNHWDNLDGHVERGYAGNSLWDWHTLPDYINPRYVDYARANASIGINGTALTNVNADAQVLTAEYLEKVAALADVFRPYGIKVYLTARFSAPVELGGLETADPLDEEVIRWWTLKVDEIYTYIPDFGGFLVKANSEGQPGPQNYGRTHGDGANLLANALAPHGGVVMWRAFVYSNEEPEDRAKQAYNEFIPLDKQFKANVLIQVKNGAIDFQPREPFHPLFGAMEHTSLMMEFQITQEYLGQGIHLTYLAPLYKECLDADTYAKGEGSTVARVIDGSLFDHSITAMAGVSNIGDDRNWCGHPIAQSNWYAYGRLAWNASFSAEEIAEDWIRMTFSEDPEVISILKKIMMMSREAGVNYRTPLGLHHQMAWHHHYGPGPWIKDKPRADWTSAYYNRADTVGIGFDRTKSGSNALSQYFPPVAEKFANLKTCPEEFLLWFHHVPWDYKMKSGRTLWDELCYKYYLGTDQVKEMQADWEKLKGRIDDERFRHVQSLLKMQVRDAIEWRNACLLYFRTYSGMPIPAEYEQAERTLEEYMKIDRKFLPGS
ncbi:MAG: alpha-glucuronidase [Bacteroidales bacterium]|nr:alpha-glucuronidase [Bacteroidales bacterium]